MYQIKSWAATFENAASRKLSSLKWFAMPTEMTSHGAITLISMDGLDGWAVFGVFNRLCQFTAGYHGPQLRGKLCRSNGDPLTLPQIAKYIGADLDLLNRCVSVLASPDVGWIEIVPDPVKSDRAEEADIEPPHNPAIDYASPSEVLPIDVTQPIPFGIEVDAIQQCDWIRIEAAFLAVWNKTKGTIANRSKGMHSDAQRLFAARCCEPGWLVDAATALSKFPLKCMTGSMRLQNFLAPETVSAINAGNYSFEKAKPGSLFTPVDNSKGVIESSMKATKELDAANKARKARYAIYRKRISDRWGADAGLLTGKDVAALDQKFPEMGLYGQYIKTTKDPCPDSMRAMYAATLHECLEQQAGGKSFKETEANQ